MSSSEPTSHLFNREKIAILQPKASFPDGGFRAWLVVLGAFCGLFTTFGWTNCVGVFQAYYQSHQLEAYSSSTISWIPASSICMLFITGPFVGRLYDVFGPRYLLLAGTFLHVFGLMMASLATNYYQIILSQAICSSLGQSLVLYPSFSCVATWFEQKRALAMGITTCGSSLAGVVMPIMIDQLINRIGFAWTMRTCAFLMLGLLVVTNLTLRSRLPPQPRPTTFVTYLRPFTDPPFLFTAWASFFYSMGMMVPVTFMVTYGEYINMPPSLAWYLVSIYNGASGIGRILPGYAADKIGNFNVSIFAAILSTVVVFTVWLPGHSTATAIAFAALFGFTTGSYTALGPALVAQISGLEEIGTRTGALYSLMSIATLTGSPIGGALIAAAGGSYWKLQVFVGTMLATGTAFYTLARMYLVKGKIFARV